MIPAGAKTGVTQSVSAISQPQDRGVQRLSRSSSAWGGFPWKSWTAFLQVETPEGEPGERAAPWEWEGDNSWLWCPPRTTARGELPVASPVKNWLKFDNIKKKSDFFLRGHDFTLNFQVLRLTFHPLPRAKSPGGGEASTSRGIQPCPLTLPVSYQAMRDMA